MTHFQHADLIRPWVTSEWGQAWYEFVFYRAVFQPCYWGWTVRARRDFERLENARRAREHD